jgi:hypothetical protein
MPQIDPFKPLLRKGIVAGINDSRGVLILDCPSYHGNSGAPVITKEIQGLNVIFNLIGIQTEVVPFVEKLEQNTLSGSTTMTPGNSGYSVAEPMDAILDLVWK